MDHTTREQVGDGHAEGSVLLIEPFYGGSHKQLIDLLHDELTPCCVKFTMSAKKWHWRARTGALHFAQTIPASSSYRTLFCSSVLNLAELTALRPDLAKLRKVLYFHENQLQYPVRKKQDRDFQYGYNQIISCLVADVILFNSAFNMESFLTKINSFFNTMPDYRAKNLDREIRPKCKVLNFPIQFPNYEDICCYRKDSVAEITQEERTQEEMTGEERTQEEITQVERTREEITQVERTREERTQEEITQVERTREERTQEEITQVERTREERTQEESKEDNTKSRLVGGEAQQKYQKNNEDSVDQEGRNNKETSSASQSSPIIVAEPGTETGNNSLDISGASSVKKEPTNQPLIIVWPHRWEHDKNPDLFFSTLFKLKENGLSFKVSVLGETYTDVPAIFEEAKAKLEEELLHWGHQASKDDYCKVLSDSDVVVSTADHEFFGVAMLEAAHLGAYPLCPNALVYPEIFPKECLYNTEQQLYKKLRKCCERPSGLRNKRSTRKMVDTAQYSWNTLSAKYKDILLPT